VRHVDLPVGESVKAAAANGLPADYAGMLGAIFNLIRDGDDAAVSDGVSRALGRPATACLGPSGARRRRSRTGRRARLAALTEAFGSTG